ncbi:MAG TPA: 16S rRNA (adenine(1518)-N(6)/adenine(1519)-N(6))-dimethyltransferase RsmA [Coriobacteriia bacterium]|nr:16S rRNA (adenine(1518)-N(6)/adenine(1519)-N(6))-dimethyltransferase RsmA [Coriobacteriia bacterium]
MTVNSPYASPRATIDRLTEWGLSTKKSLGQHFLVDDGVIGRILRLAELKAGEHVLEVGPGIGTLTEAMLLRGARVSAIEKDPRLTPLLEDMAARYPESFGYTNEDVLDFIGVLQETDGRVVRGGTVVTPHKLIANLPYSVAATIVLDLLRYMDGLSEATVMVQKEVADRMTAKPGSKNYGAYTVKLQLLAYPAGDFKVAPSCFLPPPRVDSTVIRLNRRSDRIFTQRELESLFFVIEAAFANRRKTIRNSMRAHFAESGFAPDKADALLAAGGIAPTIRGEALTPEEFIHLAGFLQK